MNEILNNIAAVANGLASLSTLIGKLPQTILPSNKENLNKLESEIQDMKQKILTVQSCLNENKRLTVSYSDALIEVSIAYALANKLAELFRHVPQLHDLSSLFISQSRENLTNLDYKLRNLPRIDSTELGRLETRLEQLNRKMLDINHLAASNSDALSQEFSALADEYNLLKLALRSYLNTLMGAP